MAGQSKQTWRFFFWRGDGNRGRERKRERKRERGGASERDGELEEEEVRGEGSRAKREEKGRGLEGRREKKTSIEAPLARRGRCTGSPSFARKGASCSSLASSSFCSPGMPLALFHRSRVREEHERGRKEDREEMRRTERRGAKVLLIRLRRQLRKEASPFLFLRSRHSSNAAYLVLGLGSQPLEERIALEGARRARLFLVRHLACFFFNRLFSLDSFSFRPGFC